MIELPEIMSEHPNHECGVVGIFSPKINVSSDLYFSLIALQNRGQENSGICVFDQNGTPNLHVGKGLVYSVFREEDIIKLEGNVGVGHNRYGTTGGTSIGNAQPFLLESELGNFAFAHNGNVFNADYLKSNLQSRGISFNSSSDSEVLAKLIANATGNTFTEKIKNVAPQIKGAYSFVIATKNSLIGARDPRGFWPLSLGKINGSGYMFASETNAIERIGGEVVGDVANGDIVTIDHEGISKDSLGRKEESLCSFEFFYFSDPYSKLLGRRVWTARFEMGKAAAREHYFDSDVVVPVPATGNVMAEGYAVESGIPLMGLLPRNRWLGRTFIEPNQRLREAQAKAKYGILHEIVNGKKVVYIDDSIVRGTTTRNTINLFWEAGAKEVNVVITAPPIIKECYVGVDTADTSELIAAFKSVEDIRHFIKATRLGYLSLESGLKSIGSDICDRLCVSCFTGKYQMQVPNKRDKLILEKI